MRIGLVTLYFHPATIGGAEWYAYNISRELARLRHEVTVYTVDKYKGSKLGPARERTEGCTIERVPLRIDLSYRAKIWKGLRKKLVQGGNDVLHALDYAQLHSYDTIRASRSAHKPAVVTVFDVHHMIPRSFVKKQAMNALDRVAARTVLSQADRVLARAPTLVDPLVEMGLPTEKIIVTPSGIREESLEPADGSIFLQKYGIEGGPVILYMGRMNPLKGPQHLVEAAREVVRKYPEAAFVFVGPDQNGYQSYLLEEVRRKGLQKNVVFTGPIYDFDLKMSAYASCDVFALPSGYEGTSQAIFEACSQARPIVATRVGGIPFQVRDGKEAVIVDWEDPQGLARATLTLLQDRGLAGRIGKNARERVKQFTYPTLARRLVEIYEEVRGSLA